MPLNNPYMPPIPEPSTPETEAKTTRKNIDIAATIDFYFERFENSLSRRYFELKANQSEQILYEYDSLDPRTKREEYLSKNKMGMYEYRRLHLQALDMLFEKYKSDSRFSFPSLKQKVELLIRSSPEPEEVLILVQKLINALQDEFGAYYQIYPDLNNIRQYVFTGNDNEFIKQLRQGFVEKKHPNLFPSLEFLWDLFILQRRSLLYIGRYGKLPSDRIRDDVYRHLIDFCYYSMEEQLSQQEIAFRGKSLVMYFDLLNAKQNQGVISEEEQKRLSVCADFLYFLGKKEEIRYPSGSS